MSDIDRKKMLEIANAISQAGGDKANEVGALSGELIGALGINTATYFAKSAEEFGTDHGKEEFMSFMESCWDASIATDEEGGITVVRDDNVH